MSNLDGVTSYWSPSISNIVLENICSFISYGLLEIGAYLNIAKDQLSPAGTNQSILRPVSSPGISGYCHFQGLRPDWIWEKNINLKVSGVQPFIPSGIYVNDVYFAEGTSVSGVSWHFNFPKGRVIFDSPIPSSWIVKASYAVRLISTYRDDSYVYDQLTTNWLQRQQNSSGIIDYSLEEKSYLPGIFVGINGFRTIRGTEQGSRAKLAAAQMSYNILTTSPWDSRQLTDILYFSETKLVPFFNVGTVPKPLNSSGSIVNSNYTWPYLVSGYRQGSARYAEDAVVNYNGDTLLPARHSRVGVSLEFDVYPI